MKQKKNKTKKEKEMILEGWGYFPSGTQITVGSDIWEVRERISENSHKIVLVTERKIPPKKNKGLKIIKEQ